MRHKKTIEKNAEILTELAELLITRPGSVVPFVGAGISMGHGLPGWTNFLLYLIDMCQRDTGLSSQKIRKLHNRVKRGQLELAAQEVFEILGRPKFETALRSKFRHTTDDMTASVMRIVQLADGLIITTNYDQIVEKAWRLHFARRDDRTSVLQLLATSEHDLQRALLGMDISVLKLHGDVDRPEAWVLTSAQYDRLYNDATFQKFLGRLFASHTPLFVGCSMTEERILEALSVGGCVGYAILPAPDSNAKKNEIAKRLKERVKIIWLEGDADGGSSYEVLDQMLHWLVVHQKTGRVNWVTSTRSGQAWVAPLEAFELAGNLERAKAWILKHWATHSCWELAFEYLRFSDLSGDPNGWSVYMGKLVPNLLTIKRSVSTDHAIDYVYGRLLGQAGNLASALDRHEKNRPVRPLADRYQVLSLFELGQLRFRMEDFEIAESIFLEVQQLLLAEEGHSRILVDVLKFLATLAVLDAIYDAPGTNGFWIRGRHANADVAEKFARAALDLATRADYPDGQAWSLCVLAFSAEAHGNHDAAEKYYEEALRVARAGRCRVTTDFHISVYYCAFLRRVGKLIAAGDALEASLTRTELTRAPDFMRLAEQRLLLALAVNDNSSARYQFKLIDDAYAATPLLADGSTRYEKRLRRLRQDLRFGALH